jgi:hypothetical protein
MIGAAVAAAAFSVLFACSSSSGNGGGSGSYPTCQGATQSAGAGSTACNSCVQSACGSQASSVESACGAYLTCYEGCQCSDLNCLVGCQGKIDGTCSSADQPLQTCISQNCASQCNGGGPGDGGAG